MIKFKTILTEATPKKKASDTTDALNYLESYLEPEQFERFTKFWDEMDANTKNVFGGNKTLGIRFNKYNSEDGHGKGVKKVLKYMDYPHFNPVTNTIHIPWTQAGRETLRNGNTNDASRDLFHMVVAELSHVKQRVDKGKGKFIRQYIARDLVPGFILKSRNPYDHHNSLEHEAHGPIEDNLLDNILNGPKLQPPSLQAQIPSLSAKKLPVDLEKDIQLSTPLPQKDDIKLKSLVPDFAKKDNTQNFGLDHDFNKKLNITSEPNNSMVHLEPQNNTPHDLQLKPEAEKMSFQDAFRTARNQHGGPGGVFTWRDNSYHTGYKEEGPNMSFNDKKNVTNKDWNAAKDTETSSWNKIKSDKDIEWKKQKAVANGNVVPLDVKDMY